MKRKIMLFIIFICMFTFCLDVKGVGKAGTGCKSNQLENLIKNTTINQKDKFCIYKNSDSKYDEYFPVQFKYNTERGVYAVSNYKTCSDLNFLDNRDSEKDASCNKYHLTYDYSIGFTIHSGGSCSGVSSVCFEYNPGSFENPDTSSSDKTCKLKDTDIELMSLSSDGDYSVITSNKGNICPATTKDKGITFERIKISKFDCNDLSTNWKIVNNKDSYTIKNCLYHLVKKSEEISSSFETQDIEEAGELVTTYIKYSNSSSSIRIIKNSDGTYKAVFNSGQEVEGLSSSTLKSKVGSGSYPKYLSAKGSKYSFSDERPESFESIYMNSSELNKVTLGEKETYATCKELLGDGKDGGLIDYIENYVMKIIWIGVPILLILLTSWDFSKVVFTSDKEGIQNAFNKFKKRAIVSILIFLTPTIIILVVKLIYPEDETIRSCVEIIRDMNKSAMIINSNLLK